MWPKKLEETLGYSLVQLQELVVLLGETHAAAPGLPQQAIQDKYKAGKYQQVATVTPRVITQVMFEAEDRHADLRPDMNTTAENIECVRQKTSTLLF